MREWVAFTGKENEQAVREEARVLTRDVINYTPPLVKNSSNDFQTIAPRVQQKAAEAAIEKDVRFKFRALQDVVSVFERARGKKHSQKVNYARVLDYIQLYAGQGRVRAIQTILRSFHYKGEVASKATEELFKSLKRGERAFILDPASIDAVAKKIIAQKKKRVGLGKSGWNKSARGLGLAAKVPKWVAGKSGAGDFTPEGRGLKFAVTLSNRVRHVQSNPDAIVGKALRRRVRSMENRMKAMTEKGIRKAR
jgi:hypothetical protein